MARPKKSATEIEARQRLKNVFWDLLEEHQLREITVGTVADRAHCNRGTFYYHFRDMDHLISSAIEDVLVNNGSIAQSIFRLTSGESALENLEERETEMYRMGLILKRGGTDMVMAKVLAIVEEAWETVLCPCGGPLTVRAQAIIEFNVGGMLALIASNHDSSFADKLHTYNEVRDLVRGSALFNIEQLALAQGVTLEEVLPRIAELNSIR